MLIACSTPAALPHECVGRLLPVPEFLTLFPGEENPNYSPGATWNKCDMKAVPLVPGLNAAPNFFMFTEAPVAGHGVGFILDDTATEFNYLAPNFGEKYSPPHLPVSVRDWTDREITRVYELALAKGIPAEDARFVLPNATPTNFQVMVNFAELLHIADLRLCWRAQWEIRHMVALMRREVMRLVPELGSHIQPKCGEKRMGYCDEPVKDWEQCPIGKVRPHKEQLFALFERHKAGNLAPLAEQDLRRVEDEGNEE